jgi:hypothetical protein
MRRLSSFNGPILLALSVLVLAAPAAAQDVPRVEVSGGYNFLRVFDDALGDEKNFPAGWYADVSGNVTPMFAIVGAVFGTYKTIEVFDLSAHGFMGGIRINSRANARVVPFGEILGGAIRSATEGGGLDESETDGLLQLGGGVNLMARPNVGVRLSADYLRVFEEDEGTNVFRFGAGIVLGFGAR